MKFDGTLILGNFTSLLHFFICFNTQYVDINLSFLWDLLSVLGEGQPIHLNLSFRLLF